MKKTILYLSPLLAMPLFVAAKCTNDNTKPIDENKKQEGQNKKTNPENPSEPTTPTNPENPNQPEQPSNPETPAHPTNPTNPENPNQPEQPTTPATPENPNQPTDPNQNNNDLLPTSVTPTESGYLVNNKYIYVRDNYYERANGLKGKELFDALLAIQRSHKTYSADYAKLYETYKTAFVDNYLDQNGTLLDLYSENPAGIDPYEYPMGYWEGGGSQGSLNRKANGESTQYNREHLVPQSWFNREPKARADAHFVWPSDKQVNNWHGNGPFGNVSDARLSKTSLNGTRIGIDETTEPINYFKGDVARALMYFQITHKNAHSKRGPEVYSDVFPYINDLYRLTYIDWNNKDRVDQIDVDRNNAVAVAQNGIRNPFIDYPWLPELIWGDSNKVFHNYGILESVVNNEINPA
ncbi:endonuclease [Mycoplasmopsis gallinarum]